MHFSLQVWTVWFYDTNFNIIHVLGLVAFTDGAIGFEFEYYHNKLSPLWSVSRNSLLSAHGSASLLHLLCEVVFRKEPFQVVFLSLPFLFPSFCYYYFSSRVCTQFVPSRLEIDEIGDSSPMFNSSRQIIPEGTSLYWLRYEDA